MKFLAEDKRRFRLLGDYSLDLERTPPRSADEPNLRADSVRVVLSCRYHWELGGWTPQGPPSWDPAKGVGAIWFAFWDDKKKPVAKKITLSHFGSSPPVNAERNAVTFLSARRIPESFLICMDCLVSSFALPDLGGGPMIFYIAANLRIYTDDNLVVDRTFFSGGGDEQHIASYQVVRAHE